MNQAIAGTHGVEEALKGGRQGHFFFSKKGPKIEALIKQAKKAGVPIKKLPPKELDRICRDNRGFCFVPQDSAPSGKNVASMGDFLKSIKQKTHPLVLILDGITDPHNLGAILRSSDLFHVDLVVLPNRRSASENDTVARTSSGASEWVPVLTTANLVRAMEELKEAGFWIYGAQMGGSSAASLDLKGPVALVMGSEGSGMSRLIQEKCDTLISIPMKGHVDSLNVSVATGILLYECRRQQA